MMMNRKKTIDIYHLSELTTPKLDAVNQNCLYTLQPFILRLINIKDAETDIISELGLQALQMRQCHTNTTSYILVNLITMRSRSIWRNLTKRYQLLPHMLLGYMNTLTLAPMDFGGRLDLNLARTTPLLP